MRLTDEQMAEWKAREWDIRVQLPSAAEDVLAVGPDLVPGAEYARLVREWAASGVANHGVARQRDLRSVDLGGEADRAAVEALRRDSVARLPVWRRLFPGGRAAEARREAVCAAADFLLTGLVVTVADDDVAERVWQEASSGGRWRVHGGYRTSSGDEVSRAYVPEPEAHAQRDSLLAELRAMEASVQQDRELERERAAKVKDLLALPHGKAWAAAIQAGAASRSGQREGGSFFDLPDVVEDLEFLYPSATAERLGRWGVSASMWLQPWLDGWRWDAAAELAGEPPSRRPHGHIWDAAMDDVLDAPFGFDPTTIVLADSPVEAVAFLAQDDEHLFGKAGVMVVGAPRDRAEALQAVKDHANGDGGGGSRIIVALTDPGLAADVVSVATQCGAKVEQRVPGRGRTWAEHTDRLAEERQRDAASHAPAPLTEKERVAARRAELGFPAAASKGLSR